MNKISALTIGALVFSGQIYCKERAFPEIRKVLTVEAVTPELTKELFVGMHPDMAIRCEAGTSLPIQFFYRVGLLSAHFNPQFTIRVEQPFYMRFTKGKVFASQDLIVWEKFSDLMDGVPNINVGMSPDRTHISIDVEMLPGADGADEEMED